MAEEWSLRDEIFYTAHRWPVFMLFCLGGVLISWLLALTIPTPYRATKELYVGLNIYQASQDSNAAQFSGIQFYNADDYKNWQMANLNSLVYIDPIIDQTLHSLQTTDPYWNTIGRPELKDMLHVYWRNAGKWRLVAEHPQSERARQAVLLWETAVIEQVSHAIDQSQQVMALHIQMQALADQQAIVKRQISTVQQLQQEIGSSQAALSAYAPDQSLSSEARWEIWKRVSQAATGPEWLPVLEAFPVENSGAQLYTSWLGQIAQVTQVQSDTLQRQATELELAYGQLTAQYAQASQQSLGLSPNLKVDPITEEPPQMSQVRPLGLLLLIGASLGSMTWLLYNLVRISQKSRR